MKKLLTISMTFLFSAFLNAQGTLQFDHVEYISASVEAYSNTSCSTSTFTINSGQVWKIVSVSVPSGHNSSVSQIYYHDPVIGNEANRAGTGDIEDDRVLLSLNGSSLTHREVPLWLPPGTYTLAICENVSVYGDVTLIKSNISAIVFNVVP